MSFSSIYANDVNSYTLLFIKQTHNKCIILKTADLNERTVQRLLLNLNFYSSIYQTIFFV